MHIGHLHHGWRLELSHSQYFFVDLKYAVNLNSIFLRSISFIQTQTQRFLSFFLPFSSQYSLHLSHNMHSLRDVLNLFSTRKNGHYFAISLNGINEKMMNQAIDFTIKGNWKLLDSLGRPSNRLVCDREKRNCGWCQPIAWNQWNSTLMCLCVRVSGKNKWNHVKPYWNINNHKWYVLHLLGERT